MTMILKPEPTEEVAAMPQNQQPFAPPLPLIAFAALFAIAMTATLAWSMANLSSKPQQTQTRTPAAATLSASDIDLEIDIASDDSATVRAHAVLPGNDGLFRYPDDLEINVAGEKTAFPATLSKDGGKVLASWSGRVQTASAIRSVHVAGTDVSSDILPVVAKLQEKEAETTSEPQPEQAPEPEPEKTEPPEGETAAAPPDPQQTCFITNAFNHYHSTRDCTEFQGDVARGEAWDRTTVERASGPLGFSQCPLCYD